MTVSPTDGTAVATTSPLGGDIAGLEDVEVTDLVIPRLRIVHADGVFEDSLSNRMYPELKCVILGLVKQRIMWDETVDEGDRPMCKSPDHVHGFPQTNEEVPKNKRFPWDKSNFNPESFKPEDGLNGHVTLPCSQCIFSEWNVGDWKQPPCSEQHTYIIMFNSSGDDDSAEDVTPALVTFQRTGIKPSKKYLSSFAQARQPMFVANTTISLQQQSRGAVTYSVPVFRKGDRTDQEQWPTWAEQVKSIRDFIRQPPRSADDEVDGESAESGAPTPKQPEAVSVSATSSSAPSESAPDNDDDLPF